MKPLVIENNLLRNVNLDTFSGLSITKFLAHVHLEFHRSITE